MKHIILITTYLLIAFPVYSQQITIQGLVYDKKTQAALPYANIIISDSQGTITNVTGYFKYKLTGNYPIQITVSYVGYEKKTCDIRNPEIHEISVNPEEAIISEAVITADFIYTLLAKAYNNIAHNYPDKDSRYKGFFRQTVSKNDSILYMGETFMDSYKSSYHNKCKDNQIEILKFRKFCGQNKYAENFKLYGGPFLIYGGDVVKLRIEIINPSYYNDYNYKYKQLVMFNNEKHYELEFENKTKTLSGKMLINKKDYAYAYFEYENNDTTTKHGYLKGPSRFQITYNKAESKYCLKSYFYNLLFTNKTNQEKLICEAYYTNTNIDMKNASPIDYNKTMSYTDIFMDKMVDSSINFWKNYNIIENDSRINNFINQQKEQLGSTGKKSILSKLKNVQFSFGIGKRQLNNKLYPNSIQTINTNSEIIYTDIKPANKSVLFGYFSVGYSLTKKSSINFTYSKNRFDDFTYKRHSLAYEFKYRIKNYGNPIFLNSNIGLSNSWHKTSVNPDEANILPTEDLIFSVIKSSDVNVETGFTIFISKYITASLNFQLACIIDYHTSFEYTPGLVGSQYKPYNTHDIEFKDKLNSTITLGFYYYISGF